MTKRLISLLVLGTLCIPSMASARVEPENFFKNMDKISAPLEKLYATPSKANTKKLIAEANKFIKSEDELKQLIGILYRINVAADNNEYSEELEALLKRLEELDGTGVLFPSLKIGLHKNDITSDEAMQDCHKYVKNFNYNEKLKEYSENICRIAIVRFYKTSPSKIWNDFNENEVAAEDRYKGKLYAVSGKIAKITTSPTGKPQITFNVDDYGMKTVVFEFLKEDRKEIAKLKKGKTVTISGICRGMVLGMKVHFTNSKIEE